MTPYAILSFMNKEIVFEIECGKSEMYFSQDQFKILITTYLVIKSAYILSDFSYLYIDQLVKQKWEHFSTHFEL